MVPDRANIDKFMLLDQVTMIDLTSNDRAKIPIMGGESKYEPFRSRDKISCSGNLDVPVEPEELRVILKYFNSLQQGSQSRNATNSASTHDVSGGGRLSYRENPDWCTNTKDSNFDHFKTLELLN